MRRLLASGINRAWIDWTVDSGVAAFSTGVALVLHGELLSRGLGRMPGAALAAAAVHGGVVLLRRRYPLPTLVVIGSTAALYVSFGFPAYMLGPAVLFALYSAGASLGGRSSGTAVAATTAAVGLLVAIGPAFPGWSSVLFYCALAVAAWWLGHLVRRSGLEAEEHARRANELAATREELARYAVSEERRRIARELHDVVAHSMTVIAMHAGTGRMVAEEDPASATSALATVERLSREALSEMRRLVGLLRTGSEDEAGTAPAPGLDDLHRLVAEVVSAGLAVDVHTHGPLAEVPPGPALAAYRIIQEALTNAVRHSGAVKAELRVEVGQRELAIQVRNDAPQGGSEPLHSSGGMGMLGMSERVNLYDGQLNAGPLPDGGYVVDARIPLEPTGR